ncbi:Hypp4743 [Branchiostoma lanceolatum]|uniref:Cleavage and polyadenylation specificity factor subunit 4 n=1 Tax=Branchiostoma lanceolatum TaxID=7740 RepID=A0A8K0ACM9_BRALA|nr:Hypp4743 [Branchiostoma lanceolatum]
MATPVDQSEIGVHVSDVFEFVAESVSRWRDVARKLGLGEVQIDVIDAEQRGNVKESCLKVLETWRQSEGHNATLESLQSVLVEAGLKNVADDIDCHMAEKSPTVFRKRKRATFETKGKLHFKDQMADRVAEMFDKTFTEEVYKDPELFVKVSAAFRENYTILRDISRGCLECHLEFNSLANFENYWERYTEGTVSATLAACLVTRDLVAKMGVDDVTVLFEMDDNDLMKARKFFNELDVQQVETLTITGGSHTTAPAVGTDYEGTPGSLESADISSQPRFRTRSGDTLGTSPRASLAECTKCCGINEDLQSFFMCSTGHLICHKCFAEHIQTNLVISMNCPVCFQDIHPYMMTSDHTTKDSVWIFVVDSNIWVEGKKLIGKERRFRVSEDPRIRIDVGKLSEIVAEGREVVTGTLYGSEPPKLDSVWSKVREQGWRVPQPKKRSQLTGREKQIDQKLGVDVTRLVCKTEEGKRGTVILVTGDADVVPVLENILDEPPWKAEIWMWEKSISNEIKSLQRSHPDRVRIEHLDVYAPKLTFTNYTYHITPGKHNQLLHQAIVFEGVQKQPDSWKMAKKWVRRMEEVSRWPFKYAWILPDNVDINDLAVVFLKGKDAEGKFKLPDLAEMLDLVKKDPYLSSISSSFQTYFSYKNSKPIGDSTDIYLSNQYSSLADMYDSVEKLEDEGFQSTEEKETEDESTALQASSAASAAAHQAGVPQHFQHYPVPSMYRQPQLTGARQRHPFYLHPVTSQAKSPWTSTSWPSTPSTEASNQWTSAPMRHRPDQYRPKYSEACQWKFNCARGRNCDYTHTPEELEFLKQRPPGLKVYKVKLCERWEMGHCRYEARGCYFAHGPEDASCLRCNYRGHLTDKCPH